MSFRTTGVLLLVLSLLGGYVYNFVLHKPAPPAPPRPYVYQYDMLDIVQIDVKYQGQSVNIIWDESESTWRFTNPSRGEADNLRINGIRLLLSGPGANRVLVTSTPTPAQLIDYGLASPKIVAIIALKNGAVHTVLLGEKTPDGGNYYVKSEADNTVYLVDYTWGDEIARFVTEPPIKKPEAAG